MAIIAETNTLKSVLLAVSATGSRLFRNNVAKAWAGKSERFSRSQTTTVYPGDVIIRNARRLHAGLHVGSSDLIGWSQVAVTRDMVGKELAVFTAIEVKTKTGRASREQLRFIEAVRAAGGFAGIARSEEDALALIQNGMSSSAAGDGSDGGGVAR